MGKEGRATAPDSPVEAMEVDLSDRVGLSVADRDRDGARVDVVAGSEFLDDGLRLYE